MIALGKEKEKSLVKQTTATQEAWVTTIFFWKTNYSSTADSHTLPEHSQHGPVRSKENWFSGPTCPLGVPSYGGPCQLLQRPATSPFPRHSFQSPQTAGKACLPWQTRTGLELSCLPE